MVPTGGKPGNPIPPDVYCGGASGGYEPYDAFGTAGADDGASGAGGGTASGEELLRYQHRLRVDPELVLEAINNQGDIVGNRDCRAFLIEAEGVREVVLGTGEACMQAVDINDARTVLGSVAEDSGVVPYLWNDGVATPLPGVPEGEPVSINNRGQVLFRNAGRSYVWEENLISDVELADGTPIHADGMNNLGQVLGQADEPGAFVIWSPTEVTSISIPLPSFVEQLDPIAINDRGMVLVALGHEESGIWSEGVYTPLANIAYATFPQAMNNAGTMVGFAAFENGYVDAPIATHGAVTVRLARGGTAVDINDRGDVIGRTETGTLRGRPGSTYWEAAWQWSAMWSTERPQACPALVPAN